MKLIKTISKVVEQAKLIYENACEKGVSEKELEKLEKNYYESLRLSNLYKKIKK